MFLAIIVLNSHHKENGARGDRKGIRKVHLYIYI